MHKTHPDSFWQDDFAMAHKGHGHTVMSSLDPQRGSTDLVRFADGSLGVRRAGQMLGVWEPSEEAQCLAVFVMQAGISMADCKLNPRMVVVTRRHRTGVTDN